MLLRIKMVPPRPKAHIALLTLAEVATNLVDNQGTDINSADNPDSAQATEASKEQK